MKRFALFALLLMPLLTVGCQAQIYHSSVSTWNSNLSGSGWAVCSTTTYGCVTGQTLTITPPSGAVITIGLNTSDTSYTWTPGGSLVAGTYQESLTLDYYDDSGNQQSTTPLTTTFVVPTAVSHTGPPPGPSALAVTLK